MVFSTQQVSGDQSSEAGLLKPPLQQQTQLVKCPRCDSNNTKFCYYNNYNKCQPRHFCKSCKRHWTKGGILRNVPVGGGRKKKRPKISNTTATSNSNSDKGSACFQMSGKIRSSSSTLMHEATKGIDNIPRKPKETNTTAFHQFSGLNTFQMDSSLFQSCATFYDQELNIIDSVEESIVTTVDVPCISSELDLPNYWNWNDSIDLLASADDLNLSWEIEDSCGDVRK